MNKLDTQQIYDAYSNYLTRGCKSYKSILVYFGFYDRENSLIIFSTFWTVIGRLN